MVATFDQILRDLKQKKFSPVYFLSGEEPYYIDAISDFISENVLSESEKAFNQTVVYGKEAEPAKIIEMALRFPMMAQYNVVIIKEAQEIRKLEEFSSYIENPSDTSILVICFKYKKIDKRTKFYKTLSKNATVFESKKIYDNKIGSWVEKYVADKGYSINSQSAALLAEHLGNDLSKIANELDKLIQIKTDNKHISSEDIEVNVGISKDYNVFELQKALGFRDVKKLTRIINYINRNPAKNSLVMIVGSLYNYFSKLFTLQYAQQPFANTAKQLGINPYFQQEFQRAMNNYSRRLDKVLFLLQEYDLKSKGYGDNQTPPEELTKELLFRIINL